MFKWAYQLRISKAGQQKTSRKGIEGRKSPGEKLFSEVAKFIKA